MFLDTELELNEVPAQKRHQHTQTVPQRLRFHATAVLRLAWEREAGLKGWARDQSLIALAGVRPLPTCAVEGLRPP